MKTPHIQFLAIIILASIFIYFPQNEIPLNPPANSDEPIHSAGISEPLENKSVNLSVSETVLVTDNEILIFPSTPPPSLVDESTGKIQTKELEHVDHKSISITTSDIILLKDSKLSIYPSKPPPSVINEYSILIEGKNLLYLKDSRITTSIARGHSNGGNIMID